MTSLLADYRIRKLVSVSEIRINHLKMGVCVCSSITDVALVDV
jgi:hypothetical protein